MTPLQNFTSQLQQGISLSPDQTEQAARELPKPDVSAEDKRTFLEALHNKGESIDEVTGFARVFRELASNPGLEADAERAIDIVGTGGTNSGGYNVSTVTAFTIAACGIPVIKHGNRAITSKSGSADFLDQFGVGGIADPAILQASLNELNFCFLFAPAFHPAFKEIMPVRKAMAADGKRSIFNILGPLINPAKPAYQLLGVFATPWLAPLAAALDALGLRSGIAVSSRLPSGIHMDEFTTAGINSVKGFGELSATDTIWTADSFALPIADPAEIQGGTPEENVQILESILEGKGPDGLVDTLVLNAAAALLITGQATSVLQGCDRARDCILGGTLASWIEQLRQFYADHG